MKKAKKYFGGIVFSICFILFLLLRRLPNNGDWYYYCNVILCSVVIVSLLFSGFSAFSVSGFLD